MKKKMVKALLIGATAMAMVVSGVGCTPKEEKVPVQSEAVKEDPNETAVKELKKYIPKVDRLKVVQNAKNLDMTKAVTGLVDEKQKDKVESVKVDDSELDESKPGTYEVTVTVTLKDDNSKTTPDSTKAPAKDDSGKAEDNKGKTEDKDTPVKEETTKPATPEKEETGKVEDSKEDSSKEGNTISGTVDVEIVDKDKVEDLTGKGDVVITDDNKVVESDKPAENKKEDDKKDEDKDKDKKPDADKKPSTDKNDKPDKKPDNNNQSSNKPNNNNSGNTSTNKPAGNQNQTTTPPANNNSGNNNSSGTVTPPASNNNSGGGTVTPPPAEPEQPQHTHDWVQQYTTVHHDEVGHNEQVWVVDSPAWDEPIYENRTICNGCGADITYWPGGVGVHSAECRSSYYNKNIQVGTTHHEEVGHYENNWVVDSPAWNETVPNGYACSCGATK